MIYNIIQEIKSIIPVIISGLIMFLFATIGVTKGGGDYAIVFLYFSGFFTDQHGTHLARGGISLLYLLLWLLFNMLYIATIKSGKNSNAKINIGITPVQLLLVKFMAATVIIAFFSVLIFSYIIYYYKMHGSYVFDLDFKGITWIVKDMLSRPMLFVMLNIVFSIVCALNLRRGLIALLAAYFFESVTSNYFVSCQTRWEHDGFYTSLIIFISSLFAATIFVKTRSILLKYKFYLVCFIFFILFPLCLLIGYIEYYICHYLPPKHHFVLSLLPDKTAIVMKQSYTDPLFLYNFQNGKIERISERFEGGNRILFSRSGRYILFDSNRSFLGTKNKKYFGEGIPKPDDKPFYIYDINLKKRYLLHLDEYKDAIIQDVIWSIDDQLWVKWYEDYEGEVSISSVTTTCKITKTIARRFRGEVFFSNDGRIGLRQYGDFHFSFIEPIKCKWKVGKFYQDHYLSPDLQWILFFDPKSAGAIFLKHISGKEVFLGTTKQKWVKFVWSPSGKFFVYQRDSNVNTSEFVAFNTHTRSEIVLRETESVDGLVKINYWYEKILFSTDETKILVSEIYSRIFPQIVIFELLTGNKTSCTSLLHPIGWIDNNSILFSNNYNLFLTLQVKSCEFMPLTTN
jgi:hypothetical protein